MRIAIFCFPDIKVISEGFCTDNQCLNLNETECKAIYPDVISGNWDPNAADGGAAPDGCYVRKDGQHFYNLRSSVEPANSIRMKSCKCGNHHFRSIIIHSLYTF